MNVLFLEDVPGTAYAGDVKEVKSGFARNYLLPHKLAVLATPDQMKRVERLRAQTAQRRAATEAEMGALGGRLEGATVNIEARAGRNNRLYGSITNVMVAEKLSALAGREIDRRRLVMEPIRQLGSYRVVVRLHQGIEPAVTVLVTSPGQPTGEVEPTAEEVVAALEKEEEDKKAAKAAEGAETSASDGQAPEAEG